MRTIKFRARRTNGEWVVGTTYFKNKERIFMFLPEPGFNNGGYWIEDVMSDTIGQFTGLYSCDGKEIYEGDILKWNNGRLYVVKFWQGMFYASVEECNEGILGGFPLHRLTEYEDEKCEIVGNIYDNPELIKK